MAWWGLAGLIVAVALLLVPPASSHAQVADSYPGRGERLGESPTEVWIEFTEAADPGTTNLELFNRTLQLYPLSPLSFTQEGRRVDATVLETLPPDGYVVKWETISAVDGHRSFGGVPFGIGADAPIGQAQAAGAPGLLPHAVIGKAMAFIGLSLVSGAFAFWYLVLPRGRRAGHEGVVERVGLAAAWMQLFGLMLFAYGHYATSGIGFSDYFADTIFGKAIVVRMALAAVLVGALTYAWRVPHVPRPVWAAIAVVVALSYVMYGEFSHTAALVSPAWLGAAVDTFHLAAVGIWTGALVVFVAFLHGLPREKAELAEHLSAVPQRFSNLATGSVVVVGATGVFMVWGVVGFAVLDWIGSLYGRLLGLKIALAVAMIVLGGLNKFLYIAKYARTGASATLRGLRANMKREVALGAGVFILAGMITNLTPIYDVPQPADDDIQGPLPLELVESSTNYVWTLQFHAAPSLDNVTHYDVALLHNATQTRETGAAFVRMVFQNTDRPELGTTEARADLTATGTYQVAGAYFTVPGRWAITYEVTTDITFREQVRVEFVL